MMYSEVMKMTKFAKFYLFFMALACAGLVSCGSKNTEKPIDPCGPSYQATLEKDIHRLGGEHAVIGDQTVVVLPLDQLFIGHSKNLTDDGRYVLRQLSPALHCDNHWNLSIKVYSDMFSNRRASLALARQQGEVVLSRLWKNAHISVGASRPEVMLNTCYHDCRHQNLVKIVTKT